ncbi:hypothetical protein EI94DRAFT_1699513 [Lactarius quietus]|nr:hypothetical protein EI94DRAFT_1699513 [Lactarius quietus]
MSSQTERRASIFDAALTCIGNRISIILLQAGEKDKTYIASLHNEVLAAVWILGLTSGGSSAVPESVRVAFCSFSNIRDPGSYTDPSGSQLPQGRGCCMLWRWRQQEASAQLHDNIINKLEEVQEKVITLESDAKGINEMLQTGCEGVEKVLKWEALISCAPFVPVFEEEEGKDDGMEDEGAQPEDDQEGDDIGCCVHWTDILQGLASWHTLQRDYVRLHHQHQPHDPIPQWWQQDSDPSLVQSHPASNPCCQDYIKSVMVEECHLQIQCANFDMMKGTLLKYELHLEQFTEVTMMIFNMEQGGLVDKTPGWAWANVSSWNWPVQMYKAFLDATSVSSSKKAHLARVSADHIDAVGCWVGNVHYEVYGSMIPKPAITVLAGFYVGETYRVPWTEVPVPGTLIKRVFPFVEETVAALRAEELQPFFWQVMAAMVTVGP